MRPHHTKIESIPGHTEHLAGLTKRNDIQFFDEEQLTGWQHPLNRRQTTTRDINNLAITIPKPKANTRLLRPKDQQVERADDRLGVTSTVIK
jgi:hypothetical protein